MNAPDIPPGAAPGRSSGASDTNPSGTPPSAASGRQSGALDTNPSAGPPGIPPGATSGAPDTNSSAGSPGTPPGAAPVVDRRTRRALRRAWRPRRSGPALVVAAGLGAVGIGVGVSVVSTLAGRPVHAVAPDRIVSLLTGTTWADPAATTAAAGLVLAGLVCLALACLPGRLRAVPVAGGAPGVTLALTRSALRTALGAAAGDVDGVDRVRVRVRPRRVRIIARTPLRDPGPLSTAVREAAKQRLDALDLARPPRLTVRVRRTNA